jgi:DNA-binding SARP family transcriptional activator
MTRFEIRLFGAPQFSLNGEPWHFAAPPRALVLLGALIANGDDFVSRGRLAAALWPEDEENDARANLRRHLHRIVKALPEIEGVEWVEATKTGLRWSPNAPCWVDVRAFEALLAQEMPADLLTAYRGDYLEAHYDEWVVGERERLRGRYADALAEHLADALQKKDYATAIAFAERLLAFDEWREDAVRNLMMARYSAGERPAALALYDRFARRLKEEFGAEPTAETRALRDGIRADALPEAIDSEAEDVWPQAHEALAPLTFAGRAAEIERLRGIWGRAARGNGSTAFVGGEAGIGKSRLARELATIVAAEGGRVLTGSTSTPEAAPYQALLVALRAGLPWFAHSEFGVPWIAALASVLPEMHGLLDDGAPSEPEDREAAQQRLFEAVARAIDRIGHGKPLLVILEDLNVAGAASLAMLASVARHVASSPVLLLVTHRTGGTDDSVALDRLIRELRHEHRAIAIALSPLAENDFSEIVARTETLHDVSADFLPRVAALSQGNPLFAAQLLYGFVEGQTDPASEPSTIGEAIFARVDRLDAEVRAVALVAAATGETFRTDFIAEVGGWGENAVLTAIATLVERRMVREAGAASFEYAFAHAVIRQTLYDSIPQSERPARHRRIAAVMSRVEGAGYGDAAVARHWTIAGDRQRARAAFERAATAAMEIYAHTEAADYARAAIDLAGDDAECLRLHSILVRSRELMPDADAFRRDCDAFVELARRLDDAEARVESLKLRNVHQLRAGDRDGQRETIDEMMAVANRSGVPEHRIDALYVLGNLEHVLGRLSEADTTYREALRLAIDANARERIVPVRANLMANGILLGKLDDVAELLAQQRSFAAQGPASERVAVASTAAWLAHAREDFDDLVLRARELLELAETIGDVRRQARAHLWLAYADHQELRVAEARSHYRRCGELSERIGNLGEMTTVALNLGTIEVEVGQAARALPHLERALEIGKQIGAKTLQAYALTTRARAFALLGRYDDANAVARNALALAVDTGEKGLMASTNVNLGAIEIAGGALQSGIAHVATGADLRRELEANETLLEYLAILTEGLLLAERFDEAGDAAAEMMGLAAARRVVATRACLAIASVARTRGDRANAFKWSQRGKSSLAEYETRLEPDDRDAFANLPWNRSLAEWA